MDGPQPPSLLGDGFELSFPKWLSCPFFQDAVFTHLQCVISEPAPLGAPGGCMRSPLCFEESWICRISADVLLKIFEKRVLPILR